MNPNLLLPPEVAAATPPSWAVACAVLLAVFLAAGLTVASFTSPIL